MTLLNRPDGPSGNMCGNKSGFATITKVSKDKDLNMAIRVQVQTGAEFYTPY